MIARAFGGAALAALRLCYLAVLTLLYAPALATRKFFGPSSGPRLLRSYFERCGGGFLKVGQLLATRPDMLRAEYCEELGSLLDNLRPIPFRRIEPVFATTIGLPVTEAFRTFDAAPLATASVAQVHVATTHTGDDVVVKILKPGIRRRVRTDLFFLAVVARVLDVLPVLRSIDVRGLAAELRRTTFEELDLEREATSTAYMHARLSRDGIAHYAPKVYRELTGPSVLTMERISGVSVREILSALHDGDHARLAEWAARGITPERTAVILLRSVLEQTIRYRAFNADPHPSNLLVGDGGTLNWVDFGLLGWIDEHEWDLQLRLRHAFANGEVHRAYLTLLEAMEPLPENRDLRAFESETKLIVRDYLLAGGDPDAPLVQKSLGFFLVRTLGAVRRHRLPMPASTVLLYRTILIADMVMLRLYPTLDWAGHLRRFLQDYSSSLIAEKLEEPLGPYEQWRLLRAPAAASETIEWLLRRLPQISRATVRTLTAGERFLLAALRVVRRGVVIALMATLYIAAASPRVTDSSWLADFVHDVEAHPVVFIVGLGAAWLSLNSYVRQLARPNR